MALYEYMKDVQRFIRDSDQKLINPSYIAVWINRARRQIALQSQSIRIVTPISGQVASITVVNGGTNYSSTPTITISAPDFPSGQLPYPLGQQATATATVTAGVITNIAVSFGGGGYFSPVVTITDSTGTGASALGVTSPLTVTQQGLEVYPFANVPLSTFSGVGEILAVKSVSFIYANYRYSLPCYSFSTYQARIRQYPLQYQYVPTMCAQLGQGANGSLYFYPIPSTAYQYELDAICLPIDLKGDGDPEALPLPWTDCVAFLATYYAYLSLQNLNAANYYYNQYTTMLKTFSTGARPGRRTNPTGPW